MRTTLNDWGLDHLEWSVTQATTELATNVILHARTSFTIELEGTANALVVKVTDGSTRRAAIPQPSLAASTGRGLALVSQLSDEWGIRPETDGKTIWCSFHVGGPASRQQSEKDAAGDGSTTHRVDGGPSDHTRSQALAA